MLKISCLIPAFNEAQRIGQVLEIVQTSSLVDEIIVVDDGSSDGTRDIVSRFSTVRLISHDHNRGKSAAICTGIEVAQNDTILMIDADLVGLTRENIDSLIRPVWNGEADISLSLRSIKPNRRSPLIWHLIGLDYISGERVLPKKIFTENLDKILQLPNFGLEVFLNNLIVKNKYRIKVVAWPNVVSPMKSVKYGFWSGVVSDIKMIRDIFKTVSPLNVLFQIIKMLKARV